MGDLMRISAPVPPDLDGYLFKLKSKQSMFGNWTNRYFRINRMNATLEYYHKKPSNSGAVPSKTLDLTQLKGVRKFDGNCIQVKQNSGQIVYYIVDCALKIELVGDGVMLRAASAAEQSCWIGALQQYMDEWNEYKQRTLDDRVREGEEDDRVFNGAGPAQRK